MKLTSIFRPLVIAFTVFFGVLASRADVASNPNQPIISPNLWEEHPREGIAVAMTFGNSIENGVKKNILHIYIKNISDIVIRFDDRHHDAGTEIYYINASSLQVPLHDYHPNGGIETVNNSFPSSKIIEPGKILTLTVHLTQDEFSLLQSHSVKCTFLIQNEKSTQSYQIETTPKLLVSGP